MGVAIGISIALGGGKPVTIESLQESYQQKMHEFSIRSSQGHTLRIKKLMDNFPYDVTYPNKDSISTMLHISKTSSKAPWSKERANACLGFHGDAAKRCSVSEILWKKYVIYTQQGMDVTLQRVKIWAEMEWIEKILQPQTWDIEKARREKRDATTIRSEKLGHALIMQLTQRYQELLMHEEKNLDRK